MIDDLIEAHGQGGSGHEGAPRPYWSSFLVADPRAAFVIETSGRDRGGRGGGAHAGPSRTARPSRPSTPSTAIPASRSRRSSIPAGGHRRRCSPPSRSRPRRSRRTSRRTSAATDGWTVCMHVEGVEATTAAMVAELPGGGPPRARFARRLALLQTVPACERRHRDICSADRVMRIAFGTDEPTALTDGCGPGCAEAGHEVVDCGDGDPWPDVGRAVGEAVAAGRADRGVVCCWTGTGRVDRGEQGGRRARRALHRRRDRTRGAPLERRERPRARPAPHLRTVADEVVDAFLTTDVDPQERDVIDRLS